MRRAGQPVQPLNTFPTQMDRQSPGLRRSFVSCLGAVPDGKASLSKFTHVRWGREHVGANERRKHEHVPSYHAFGGE